MDYEICCKKLDYNDIFVFRQTIHSGYYSMDVTLPSNLLNESMQNASTSKKMRVTAGFPGLIEGLNDVAQFRDMWLWYEFFIC